MKSASLPRIFYNGAATAIFFICIRILIFALLPYQFFTGFGDLVNFYRVAQVPGWPFIDYWVEFPPVFPFLSEVVFRLTGTERLYAYTMAAIFTLFDAGTIIVFAYLSRTLNDSKPVTTPVFYYGILLAFFPYCWWYFESLIVFITLYSVALVFNKKRISSIILITTGVLTKIFPIIALIPVWFSFRRNQAIQAIGSVVFLTAATVGVLWLISPEFTSASINSQFSKGSSETIWALLAGNYGTGNFGPLKERLDPSLAYISRGNRDIVPPIIPILIAGLTGLIILIKMKNKTVRGQIALMGLAWCLIALVLPGWSPQWVLLILPICLLTLPLRISIVITLVLLATNLTEWPLLISRGRIDLLWTTILIRSMLTFFLAILFTSIVLKRGEFDRQNVPL